MWQKIVKWVLFPLFFFTIFLVALYWTFPARTLKRYVASQLEHALSSEHEGRWTHPPEVSIGDFALWRLSGVEMKNVMIRMGSLDENFGAKWDFEDLRIRLGLFSSLLGNPKVEFAADLYDGSAKGAVTVTKTNQVSDFWIEMNNIDLKKFSGFEEGNGLPLSGALTLEAEFALGKNPAQDGEGTLIFAFNKLAIGPGKLNLPMPGFSGGLSVPHVNLGEFLGDLELNKGKGKTRQLKMTGGDLELDANIAVELSKDIMRSKIDGNGWFKIADKFLKTNPSFKSLIELTPDLKSARESDGKYPFSIKGTFDRPRPRMGKDKQSSAKDQKNPLRSFRS